MNSTAPSPAGNTSPPLERLIEHIQTGAHESAFGLNLRPTPSDAQCHAGNYKVGRIQFHGLPIAIEQPQGTYRTGQDASGKRWATRLDGHYGYVSGTRGADGDPVDCFVGFYPQSDTAYVINQHVGGRFDEHKVMLGYPDEESARTAYLNSYERGWSGLRSLVPMSVTQLKWWLKNGDMKRPIAAENLPYDGLENMNTLRVYWDGDKPRDQSLSQLIYDIRRADDSSEQREQGTNGLIFDAVTMGDILADSDGGAAVLDAMVVQMSALQRKASILQLVMGRANGSVKPVSMQVSDPFTKAGAANVAVIYELSDGQTITIFFHNPDVKAKKLQPDNELTSWKWLLNKRDITIVVAPERGQDLDVKTVAQRVMALAEKNSAPFAKANAKRAETMQAIAGLQSEIADLEGELKTVQGELEVAKMEAEDRKAMPVENDAAVVSLTGTELGAFPDTEEGKKALREAAVAYFDNELIASGGVMNKALNKLVEFDKNGRGKVKSFSADTRKLKMVPALRSIVADGVPTPASPIQPHAKAARKGVKLVHVLKTPIRLGGSKMVARFLVYEKEDGHLFYDHSVDSSDVRTALGGSSGAMDSVDATAHGIPVLLSVEPSTEQRRIGESIAPDAVFDSTNNGQEKGPDESGPIPVTTTNGGGTCPSRITRHQLSLSIDDQGCDFNLDSASDNKLVFNLFIEGEAPEEVSEEEDDAVQDGEPKLTVASGDFDPTTPENYAQIKDDLESLTFWQDALDAFFAERIVAVRNAMREFGWEVPDRGLVMQKTVNDARHSVKHEVRQVGAGANVVGVTWSVDGGTAKIEDDLTKTPEALVAEIDGAVPKAGQEQSGAAGSDGERIVAEESASNALAEVSIPAAAGGASDTEPPSALQSEPPVAETPESASADSPQKTADRALLQSVIDGTVANILSPELADEIEAAYTRHAGDPEIEALFMRAVEAYTTAMMAATAAL